MKEQEERKKIIDYIFEVKDILDTANIFVKEGFDIPKGITDDLLSIDNKIVQIRNFIVYNGDKELACFVNTIIRWVSAQIQGWYNMPEGHGGKMAIVLAFNQNLMYEMAYNKFDSCVMSSEKEEELQDDRLRNERTEKISIVTNATPKKKGRPSKTFDAVLVGNKEATKKKLHGLIDGKSGRDAVIYIKTAITLGIILRPTHTQFIGEFGNIASKQIYNKYLSENLYYDGELEGAKQALMNG